MAATVHSGLQSCLESQLIESRVLSLKLPPLPSSSPATFHAQSIELAFKSCFRDPTIEGDGLVADRKISGDSILGFNLGGFSSLQALSNPTHFVFRNREPFERLSPPMTSYVPPTARRTSLVLSERSLQLCTENLGNETGTDMADHCIDNLEAECGGNLATREQVKSALPRRRTKTAKAMQKFPPALTTMTGSNSLRVRSHREEGRLIVKAVKVPSSASCFRAERCLGRLRLCFLKNEDMEAEREDEEMHEEDEEQEGNYVNGQSQVLEEEREQESIRRGEERDLHVHREDNEVIDGNSPIPGDDMEMEKNRERPKRCNHCEHESTWEAILIATS